MMRVTATLCALVLLFSACGDDDVSTDSTTTTAPTITGSSSGPTTTIEAAELTAAGKVRCLIAQVAAGQPPTLADVSDCGDFAGFTGLNKDDVVTVDTFGEAEVYAGSNECGPVYVFESSGLKLAGCRRAESLGGGATACLVGGTAVATSLGCPVQIRTLSAITDSAGTVFTVTYDEETQTTLVAVLDGEVMVTPLDEVGEVFPNQEPSEVFAGEFYFTSPEALPIAGLPPRTPTSMLSVSAVITQLQAGDAFEGARDRAAEQGIDESLLLNIDAIVARVGGGFLEDAELAAGIIGGGIDWIEFLKGDVGGVLFASSGFALQSLYEVEFDPDRAVNLAEEAGAGGQAVVLVTVGADPRVEGIEQFLFQSLESLGFEIAQIFAVDTVERGTDIFNEFAQSGMPVLMIGP